MPDAPVLKPDMVVRWYDRHYLVLAQEYKGEVLVRAFLENGRVVAPVAECEVTEQRLVTPAEDEYWSRNRQARKPAEQLLGRGTEGPKGDENA